MRSRRKKHQPPKTGDPVESTPTERHNVSPGEPSIVKIGTKSRDEIINDLKHSDRDPNEYAKGKLTEHLKLLWKRGR